MSEAVPSVPLTYLHRMHRDNFTFLIFHVHCVKCVTIPPSSVQGIIYWTLLKYLRRCKIHWYLYCNVDKTFYILMRLIIVVKICFLKFRTDQNFQFCAVSGGTYCDALTVTDSLKFPSLTALSDGSVTWLFQKLCLPVCHHQGFDIGTSEAGGSYHAM